MFSASPKKKTKALSTPVKPLAALPTPKRKKAAPADRSSELELADDVFLDEKMQKEKA